MGKSGIILVGIILILFSGCKSTKEYYTKEGTLRNIADYKLINSTTENYLNYNTLFYKRFKARYEDSNNTLSFTGNLYIEKDSSIVVSVLKGIEWFRVRLTNNSVEILDKRKKTYTSGDYKILWDKFMVELDYHTLQSILTNQLFVYPINSDQKLIKRYKHEVGIGEYLLQSVKTGRFERKYRKEKTNEMIFHQFSIMPDVFKISKVNIKDFNANSELDINYDNFLNINKSIFPSIININGQRGNDSFSIELRFEHIDIDSDSSLGFKFSDKYKKVVISNED
ncbi:DUF4292 domain-containing protein [Carboxylicivirga sp. RSCT41]|uniref:DUF4292 domain-containing protein n=1 Tax=Carboxylicivirga agarovorans TaxID=3417570 RepID=UPI003D34D1B5